MDFLMTAIFIMGTLGVLGAYVTDFPLVSGLYPNEVAHKTALASLFGMLFGLILFFIFTTVEDTADSSPMSPQGMFFSTWAVMSAPVAITHQISPSPAELSFPLSALFWQRKYHLTAKKYKL